MKNPATANPTRRGRPACLPFCNDCSPVCGVYSPVCNEYSPLCNGYSHISPRHSPICLNHDSHDYRINMTATPPVRPSLHNGEQSLHKGRHAGLPLRPAPDGCETNHFFNLHNFNPSKWRPICEKQ